MYNLFCHFERSVSEVEKSKNVQFIPCHFERSFSEVEKSKNVGLCNHEILRRCFRTDTVVASITTQPLLVILSET